MKLDRQPWRIVDDARLPCRVELAAATEGPHDALPLHDDSWARDGPHEHDDDSGHQEKHEADADRDAEDQANPDEWEKDSDRGGDAFAEGCPVSLVVGNRRSSQRALHDCYEEQVGTRPPTEQESS